MKNFIIICIGVLLLCNTNTLYAQQDPLFAQYNANPFLINPAVAGSKGNHAVNLFHRWQWVRFPGAPQTFGLTYQGTIWKDKKNGDWLIGMGGMLFGDVTGPSSRWGGKLSGSVHRKLGKKTFLSLGFSGRLAHNIIRTDMIHLIDPNDQAVANSDPGNWSIDLEVGLYLYTKNLSVGFAAPNLGQRVLNFSFRPDNSNPIGRYYRHYYLTAAYKIRLPKKKIIFEPSIMLRYVQGAIPQFEGGITVHVLDEQVAFGLYYRYPAFLSFQCKVLFDKRVPVLLGFDVALNSFQQHSLGSTELMIGYEFPGSDVFEMPEVSEEPDGSL